MESLSIFEADFWWIEEERHRPLYVGVGHHRPLTDDEDPLHVPWFHSLKNGQLCLTARLYPLSFIDQWRKVCDGTNVYRTLKLFGETGQPALLGPFLVDLDSSRWADGYQEDLDEALELARRTISLLTTQFGVQENDLRVFFSGRKGFNIEVRPSSLGIGSTLTVNEQIRLSGTKLDSIIDALGNTGSTVVDRIYDGIRRMRAGYYLKHEYIRLHDSINSWVQKDGNQMARRKIRLGLPDTLDMSVEPICEKAQANV